MLRHTKKLISHDGGVSFLSESCGKRRKKADIQNETKRTKVDSETSSVATNVHVKHLNDAGNDYSAFELLNLWKKCGAQLFYNEFLRLRNEKPSGTFHTSLSRPNVSKNRYNDILCLDHSRVVLKSFQSSDYINANFVDGYKQKDTYIATQGPLPHTCKDFWQMVWDQNVCVIVMTTRTVEKGHQKCAQYWPSNIGKTQQYDCFTVVNKNVTLHEQFTETELLLCDRTTNEERSIIHLIFTSWPDHGVPSSAKEFLDFMNHVHRKQKEQISRRSLTLESTPKSAVSNHPVVVHCSAGIGRTGTFITVDTCTQQLMDVGQTNILAALRKIRSQRAFSIQTVDQYIFCHKALIEFDKITGLTRGDRGNKVGRVVGEESGDCEDITQQSDLESTSGLSRND